jgi:hypothetical protein
LLYNISTCLTPDPPFIPFLYRIHLSFALFSWQLSFRLLSLASMLYVPNKTAFHTHTHTHTHMRHQKFTKTFMIISLSFFHSHITIKIAISWVFGWSLLAMMKINFSLLSLIMLHEQMCEVVDDDVRHNLNNLWTLEPMAKRERWCLSYFAKRWLGKWQLVEENILAIIFETINNTKGAKLPPPLLQRSRWTHLKCKLIHFSIKCFKTNNFLPKHFP